MKKRLKAPSIHPRFGGWIVLFFSLSAMILAGIAFSPREAGIARTYAPIPFELPPGNLIKIDGDGVRLNLNEADEAMLMSLRGIGKVRAAAIVAYREENGAFESVEELMNVKGIGEKIIESLRGRVFADKRK